MFLLPTQKEMQKKTTLRIAKLRNEKPGQKLRKTEQQRKGNFLEVLLQLKSKNFKQTPETNCMEHAVKKNSDQKDDLVIYCEFFRQADRICFWTACTNF